MILKVNVNHELVKVEMGLGSITLFVLVVNEKLGEGNCAQSSFRKCLLIELGNLSLQITDSFRVEAIK